jgi:hypothetical protein
LLFYFSFMLYWKVSCKFFLSFNTLFLHVKQDDDVRALIDFSTLSAELKTE